MKSLIAVAAKGMRLCVPGIAAVLMLAGCSTPQMKGTPFYTGEYSVRRGPAEDRIAMWPLVYYRDPALSVLWPFIEKTDDHFAIRPLMSIYGLDKEAPIYNVLWPVSRFNMQTDDHRVFPFFWGDDYAVGFPLFWHFDDPFGGDKGYNGLVPLWSYRNMHNGYSLHLAWPVFHRLKRSHRSGWRVWPLAGHYRNPGETESFLMWPLGKRWHRTGGPEESEGAGGSMLLPLYYHDYTPRSETLLTLPYSRGRDSASGTDWDLAFPLLYSKRGRDERALLTPLGGYNRKGDESGWLAPPLLSGGRSGPRGRELWVGGPLAHFKRQGDRRKSHVLPLYYRSRTPARSLFVSLPWSHGSAADGDSWQLAAPLYYRGKSGGNKKLITPLYAAGKDADRESEWDALLPLYFRKKTPERNLFTSLLGGYERRANGKTWLIYPLLSRGRVEQDEGSLWLMAPLFHASWSKEGSSHHLLPLYYWNGVKRTLISPLAARWGDESRRMTAMPPLLSLLEAEPKRTDLWTLGGLAHLSWGEKRGDQYLFPLFYNDPVADRFLSPLWSSWRSGGTDWTVVPPLMSAWSKDGDSLDVWAAGGLFHSRDAELASQRRGHLLPLYMYDGKESFYTPLFGRNRNPHNGFYYALTPLLGVRTGHYAGGWIFPFFSRQRNWKTGDTEGTFLWGEFWQHAGQSHASLFPFYRYHDRGPVPVGRLTAADRGRYGSEFSALFLAGTRHHVLVAPDPRATQAGVEAPMVRVNQTERWFFPVFNHERQEAIDAPNANVDASVLFFLWDYQRKVRAKAGGVDDYTRARVLWRAYHYERVNGDVSVDVFPFVTYDRKRNGYRKTSFMWRFFRHERKGRRTKLDVCFLPLIR